MPREWYSPRRVGDRQMLSWCHIRPSLQWLISEWPGFVCIFHVFSPRGGHDGHYADRFFFIRCRQGHNGFIHWTNGRNEAAVSQKRFLQIKSLHPAGHQIHSDAPGTARGTARTSSLNVCRFCGGKVIDTIPCQSPPAWNQVALCGHLSVE